MAYYLEPLFHKYKYFEGLMEKNKYEAWAL